MLQHISANLIHFFVLIFADVKDMLLCNNLCEVVKQGFCKMCALFPGNESIVSILFPDQSQNLQHCFIQHSIEDDAFASALYVKRIFEVGGYGKLAG